MTSAPGLGVLYVVGTPIGNREDWSPRAVRIVRESDAVFAEDTRSARTLLQSFLIERRVESYFDGNEAMRAAAIGDLLRQGKHVVVMSEAGMPGVSDPGQRAVEEAALVGARVEVVGGPSASLCALVGSGLPMDRFLFVGFPPRSEGERHPWLADLANMKATLVLYEAPDRVGQTLADASAAFGGDRRACVSREISKVYEEHARGDLATLAARYGTDSPRGECVICIEGARTERATIDIEARVRELLASGVTPRDISRRLMIETGKSRNALYQLAVALKSE